MTQAVRILFTVFFLCFTDVCFFTKDFGYSSMHSRIYKMKTPLSIKSTDRQEQFAEALRFYKENTSNSNSNASGKKEGL